MPHTYQRQLIFVELADSWLVPAVRRAWMLRHAGVIAGPSTRIGRGVVVQGLGTLVLGMTCTVGDSVYFDVVVDVSIGDNVVLGDHVRILTSSHDVGASEQRAGQLTGRPVVIGDGCTIGAHTVILPGVTIGDGTVVDDRSLVTKDCEPRARYSGSPAVRVDR